MRLDLIRTFVSTLLVPAILVGCGGSGSSKADPGQVISIDSAVDPGTHDSAEAPDAAVDLPDVFETVEVQALEDVASDSASDLASDLAIDLALDLATDSSDAGEDAGAVETGGTDLLLDAVIPDAHIGACSTDSDCEPGNQWCTDGTCVDCDNSGLACFLVCPEGESLYERNGCHPCECKAVNQCAFDVDCGPGMACVPGQDCIGWCLVGDPSCCYGNQCWFTCAVDGDCKYGVCSDGYCRSIPCTPYAADPTCGTGRWCLPDYFVSGSGSCVGSAPVGLPEGAGCSSENWYGECVDGSVCVDSLCTRLCDPVAIDNAPGSCLQPENGRMECVAMAFSSEPDEKLAIGFCSPAGCIYNHSPGGAFEPVVACASADEVCQPGEIVGLTWDPCRPYANEVYPLDEFAGCPSGSEYEFCRPGGACFRAEDSEPLQCREFCSGDVAPGLGFANHPDCTRTEAVCSPVFGAGSLVGVCT